MFFYEFLLGNVCHAPENQGEFTFKALAHDETHLLADILQEQRTKETLFEPLFDVQGARQRINRGEICVVGEHNRSVIGYGWFAPGKRYIPELQYELLLADDEFYCYNGYVYRGYRGKNIIGSIILTAFSLMQKKGFKRAITGYLHWNRPSERAARKLSFSPIGTITVGYFLTFRFNLNRCKRLVAYHRAHPFDFHIKLSHKLIKSSPVKYP